MGPRLIGLAAVVVCCVNLGAAEPERPATSADALATAREHLQKGRYDEAREAYAALLKQEPEAVAAALGWAAVAQQTGDLDGAAKRVAAAVEHHPQEVTLWTRQAEIQLFRGEYAAAQQSIEAALQLDADHVRAHAVQGDLHTEAGRIEEALEEYRWCVRYYNRAQPTDADTLLAIADGSLQYARWKGVSSIFNFVLNTLCPDALKADENRWQAVHLSGRLLLEKYNKAEAAPEFNAALAINPQAAEVHASLGEAALQDHDIGTAKQHADRALAINPQLPQALLIKVDVALMEGDLEESLKQVESALAVNPVDQRSLARKGVVFLLQDGVPPEQELDALFSNLATPDRVRLEQPSRFTQIVIDLARRNPKPGYFLSIVGESLEARMKYAAAERFYREAIAVMPVLSAPRTSLGLLAMRTGRLEEAEQILNEAFKADPYHIRVSNMRKVVGVLKGYEVMTTDHFVIRVDAKDKLLAEYMAEYLEGVYAELTEQYGFEPPVRTQFEVFNDAKGQSAHQWFSARMIGLPWIQTIGASTGMIVALASPTTQQEPFNWARVLKHEFVHILTLQQTGFNIPHWYTEALAVRSEGLVMPESWEKLLLERVPTGEIFTLDTVNRGFQRPEGPSDWHMAYCQSRLYAQYMEDNYGVDSLSKLVDAYRRNLKTSEAIPEVFGVSQAEFEQGYRAMLDELVERLRTEREAPPVDLEQARAAYEAASDDPARGGDLAYALLHAGQLDEALMLAEKVVAADPRRPLAAAVLADAKMEADKIDEAIAYLEAAYNAEEPHPVVLRLLAESLARADRPEDAAALYELGTQRFPREGLFWNGLADVLRTTNDRERLQQTLAHIARRKADDKSVRKELARLALDAGDHAACIQWGLETIYVDVNDPEVHEWLGQCYEANGENDKALREYEAAVQLNPENTTAEIGLARLLIASGDSDRAHDLLDKILQDDPDHAEAKRLKK